MTGAPGRMIVSVDDIVGMSTDDVITLRALTTDDQAGLAPVALGEASVAVGSLADLVRQIDARVDRPHVFISYRRSSGAQIADAIAEHAERALKVSAFVDRHGLHAGEEWNARLAKEIQESWRMYLVISSDWGDRPDGRLHHPDDVVRCEVRAALGQGLEIIPVLVERPPPDARDLPDDLHALVGRHMVELRVGEALERQLSIKLKI